jgi:hypothetical protein
MAINSKLLDHIDKKVIQEVHLITQVNKEQVRSIIICRVRKLCSKHQKCSQQRTAPISLRILNLRQVEI